MTLPASGILSLGDIQGEFGGVPPTPITEYYGAAAGVPVAGILKISDFYGTSSLLALVISADTNNYDIKTEADLLFGTITTPTTIQLTVDPGVIVGSINGGISLDVGIFPAGSNIILINNGTIAGFGGNAGAPRAAGQAGGTAINTTIPLEVINNGIIAGGGGGGGGGDAAGSNSVAGGGGAGTSVVPGVGGAGNVGWGALQRNPSDPGTLLLGGLTTHNAYPQSRGGKLGLHGGFFAGNGPYGPGGAAGLYIVGDALTTWTVIGDRRGRTPGTPATPVYAPAVY